jgi:hypothetical protein
LRKRVWRTGVPLDVSALIGERHDLRSIIRKTQLVLPTKCRFARLVALVALLFITGELRVLPFLLLLACPLMHMLMHRGHGKHNSDRGPH